MPPKTNAAQQAQKTNAAQQAAQQAQTQPQDYSVSGKIVQISLHPKDESRYIITFSQEFDGYNEKGELVKTNSFGINYFNLQKQLCELSPEFAMASAMALGQRINRQIVSLLLVGADATIFRAHKNQGEEREFQRENEAIKVYESNAYTTKFTKAVCAPSQLAIALIQQLMLSKPTDTVITTVAAQTTTAQFNPFI